MSKDQKMSSVKKVAVVFDRILPEVLALTAPERGMLLRKFEKLFVNRV